MPKTKKPKWPPDLDVVHGEDGWYIIDVPTPDVPEWGPYRTKEGAWNVARRLMKQWADPDLNVRLMYELIYEDLYDFTEDT